VTLTVPVASEAIDTRTGASLGALNAGSGRTLDITLDEHRSRVVWIRHVVE
jgi:hypothetical protein